jgi:hypothetical protein
MEAYICLLKNLTPWRESASALYRPSDRHLSAKLVPSFADRECHGVSVTDPYDSWRESASALYPPSDCHLSAKLVPLFVDRECHLVSVTDPYYSILRLSRSKPLLFLPSSTSVVLTRLSEPRFRPTTSQKIW